MNSELTRPVMLPPSGAEVRDSRIFSVVVTGMISTALTAAVVETFFDGVNAVRLIAVVALLAGGAIVIPRALPSLRSYPVTLSTGLGTVYLSYRDGRKAEFAMSGSGSRPQIVISHFRPGQKDPRTERWALTAQRRGLGAYYRFTSLPSIAITQEISRLLENSAEIQGLAIVRSVRIRGRTVREVTTFEAPGKRHSTFWPRI
jgi:hypothetical protein